MKTVHQSTLAASIAAVAAACPGPDVSSALRSIPFDELGDDYRRDPEAACRKALRLTRAIRRPSRRLRAIDRLLGMHGVESVSFRNGEHAFSYANSGDSYACTVALFASGTFRVTSWGDVVERSNRYA
jgi:hypothetical protein